MLSETYDEVPRGNAEGFKRYFRYDFVSGAFVFLIALPLCLGISLASGYPPMAGIFTAIVGAVVATFISNSELTIKGPAAGLIVIALGCIEDFGGDGFVGGFSADDLTAYRAALAIGVAAAVLQMIFATLRAGIVGEFFPITVVHGMLAAIGVIIITKQFPVTLGVMESMEPFEMIKRLPEIIENANPAIAAIGLVSLLILFLWPMARNQGRLFQLVPAPVVVALVAIPMGLIFDLRHSHSYFLSGHEYELNDRYLVSMPNHMFGMFEEITLPDLSALSQPKAWKWVFLFFVIGTLESVLSTKAVDLIDPWKRKTAIDRDIMAIGAGNLAASMVGGLPMISEIVRSKSNIDNGARTRFANLWHGILLLVCVALIPTVLHLLPLAALAAMLVYTGFRLAHPSEFLHVYHIGREQLVVFVVTLVAVLATDLLIGVAIGIAVELIVHVLHGAPPQALFTMNLDIEPVDDKTCLVRPHEAAVFSNWIPFRRQIERHGLEANKNIVLDLADVRLIDHSVMGHLRKLQRDFQQVGLQFTLRGLDAHTALSSHEESVRKRGLPRMKRLTLCVDTVSEQRVGAELAELGATGFSCVTCRNPTTPSAMDQVRMEFLIEPESRDAIMQYIRRELAPTMEITVCVETIKVFRPHSHDEEHSNVTWHSDRRA